MKILLLSDPSSPHTIKWANSLSSEGIDIFLFGLSEFDHTQYDKNVKIEIAKMSSDVRLLHDGAFQKIIYLKALPKLKKILKNIKPDILHAHYSSSYGLLGSLCRFNPFFVSVWGNDIFDFPGKSFLFSKLTKFVLSKSDKIFSTSKIMAEETSKYTNKLIITIPFGINTNTFSPGKQKSLFEQESLVVGSVKTLAPNYGLEFLIRAFEILVKRFKDLPLKLLIVGKGELEKELKQLVHTLEISDKTMFTGFIPHSAISEYHNYLDIAVYPSVKESFGVSVLESMSCEKPVVASAVGGIPEVIENNKTGLLVRPSDHIELSEVIASLIESPGKRKELGKAARESVLTHFRWEDNCKQMIKCYEEQIGSHI